MEQISLGEKLYRLREEHKLSQSELAEKLNVTRQTISNWENDKVKLDFEKATEICRLYHIGLDELAFGAPAQDGGFAKQNLEPTSNPKDKRSAKRGALLVGVIAALLIAAGIALFFFGKREEYASSVVILTQRGGGIALCVCGAVVLGVALYFMIKNLSKK